MNAKEYLTGVIGEGAIKDPLLLREIELAMIGFAKMKCGDQKIQCAKEATCSIDWVDFHDFSLGIEGAHVDDYSILDADTVEID